MTRITFAVFEQSLQQADPPSSFKPALKSLWYAYQNNWSEAHDLVDQLTDPDSCWVHAYLHRWEGDEWNARYWYRRAKKNFPTISLDRERESIVKSLTLT